MPPTYSKVNFLALGGSCRYCWVPVATLVKLDVHSSVSRKRPQLSLICIPAAVSVVGHFWQMPPNNLARPQIDCRKIGARVISRTIITPLNTPTWPEDAGSKPRSLRQEHDFGKKAAWKLKRRRSGSGGVESKLFLVSKTENAGRRLDGTGIDSKHER